MPETCCAVGCNNIRDPIAGISLYRIPKEKERRAKWLAAIDRKAPDGGTWEPTTHHRLCSQHFASGSKSDHPLHPDYVPSIFHHTPSPKKRRSVTAVETFNRRQECKRQRHENARKSEAAPAALDPSLASDSGVLTTDTPLTSHDHHHSGVQTQHCGSDQCKAYFKVLENECQSLRNEIYMLREKVSTDKFDELSFKGNDEKVKTMTGFSSYEKMKVIFGSIEGHLMINAALSPFQQFIMTLLRLRLNVTLTFLAFIFCISLSSASRVFHHCLNVMHIRLVPALIRWPGREELRMSLPYCFRQKFKKCVAIIDCFEIFIDRPQMFLARSQTYSSYKSHNTMKYLISVTPQGTVSFISEGWGGRASDKHIVNNSGFLEKLLPGDLVLADRGFTVSDSVALYSAELLIPAFTKGKKQLDPIDIEKTRGLASVRIHVERVIGHVRKKYCILGGPIPMSLLEGNGQQMTLDKVVHVCCALTNVSESVVPFE